MRHQSEKRVQFRVRGILRVDATAAAPAPDPIGRQTGGERRPTEAVRAGRAELRRNSSHAVVPRRLSGGRRSAAESGDVQLLSAEQSSQTDGRPTDGVRSVLRVLPGGR